MIRQYCPHCYRPVELPDSAAGTTHPCPLCAGPIPVPPAYTPTVEPNPPPPETPPVTAPLPDARPAPPPGFVPPADPAAGPTSPGAARSHGRGVALDPAVLDWFPAGCFTLILLLTFLSWVGVYPGGYPAYTQSAWGAAAGGFTTDHFSDDVIKIETRLQKTIGSNVVMALYLLGLLVAVAVAWADRLVAAEGLTKLPPRASFLAKVWPHRFPILAGLAVGLVCLLLIQTYAGFGLETGLRAMVAGDNAEAWKAAGTGSAARQKVAVKEGLELGQYQLQTTTWLGLALGTHVVAVAAAGLRLWLYRRGPKPVPRAWAEW